MAYVLIILALLALAGAAALWFADERETSSPRLPGAGARARRAWAKDKGFDFARADDALGGEWGRGPAAAGARPRNVAAGSAFGHDVYLADVGAVAVMVMRTGEVSDVVVEMRREGLAGELPADVVEVATTQGFRVASNEPGPAQRFIDVRVRTALEEMPEAVSAVWCESEWAAAQFAGPVSEEDADATLAPLALIADAARVLPPRRWGSVAWEFPTREVVGVAGGGGVDTRDAFDPRPVKRPEEPLEMPTRATGAVRGTLERRAVGGDEIDPIADGPVAEQPFDLTRVRRNQVPPSIFGDE
ncbi:hypothetical protein [Corynebacterium liangguodongii]|uniref:Uncharacterized protein n=1 Tax=Corynebacterium liangguodongii TaxID=2079535 RepID=A0A2S0WG06_9CORY|nr:hypothetical protein [Corynebacterium liangguodongii]AWB84718.1 hypothetical protein C3E79_09725 [Corynebacterium liangguodongii]PWB99726.1 hypothetical protein DF219_05505 [Corynebacterium liangguodongii]